MEKQDPRRRLGAIGEALAADRLERAGYRILDRNVRCGGVELDLVVARGRVLAFVEVKTRRSRALGAPELAVDARKRARLVRGAAAWLREHGARGRQVRFDVAAVEPDAQGQLEMRHLAGAFDAGDV
jgi:putative endonuclease